MRKRLFPVLASAALVAGLLAAYVATRETPPVQAQEADDPPLDEGSEPVTETAEPNSTIEPGPPPHDPFTLHPADEGAVGWDEMTPAEQAGAEASQDWAENSNGEAVHNAFAAAVATTVNMNQVEAAQTASGLDGIETLGVVP